MRSQQKRREKSSLITARTNIMRKEDLMLEKNVTKMFKDENPLFVLIS
jgi:hypothetical protein